ncbi:TonB-dependent receptor [Pontibacter arcticus]|uniref:TonB-dependent receptor n=1 Tax=Pontibacter arcticus TaxID=2080288 RepID=A0A364RIN6_9BACT|nr:TonB-dependent receptor [Pontibacter arcticus]RAU84162.1 TonB-dependent receptor [Pontibacter arcticus]
MELTARYTFILFTLLVLTGMGQVWAQQTDTIQGGGLHEVEIRTHRLSEQNTSPHPVQTLQGAQLEQLNSLSVADALRYFTGIQLKDYGGIGGLKTVNVRSMGSQQTAVFLDGVQVGNAQNGQVDLGKFSLDNLEQISLYNGHKNSLLQPAKSFSAANALYLQARMPHFAEGEKTHGKASIRTGSFGLINPSVLWQQKITDHIYSTLSAEWTQAHGKYKFRYTNGVYDTTATRHNADINAFRVEAGLQGILPDSSNWALKLYSYTSERGLPGAIVANRFRNSQRLWDRTFFVQSSYNKTFGERYQLLLNGKFTNDYTRYLDPEYNNIAGALDSRYTQREVYFSAAGKYKITSFWDVGLSGDVQYNTLDANSYNFANPTRTTALVALATQLHFNQLEVQASLLSNFISDEVESINSETAAPNSDQQHKITPAFSVLWQPSEQHDLRLRAFYKDIFRMPTFNERYYTSIGTSNLRPEFTRQFNIGVTYAKSMYGALRYFSVQTDAYQNYIKDKIVAVPSANLFRWTMLNLDEVEIRGLETAVQSEWQLAQRILLNIGLNYTFQQALDVTPGSFNYRDQIPYTPLHSGSFTSGATWKNLNLNYSFIYTGERYSQKANIPVNYVQPWYTHDLSASYTLNQQKLTYKLGAEVNNLFNQYYDVILNFPMPGRSYRVSLSINF